MLLRAFVTLSLLFVMSFVFIGQSFAGTVGYWRFEEGTAGMNPPEDTGGVGFVGAIIDSSPAGNHGTAYQVADLTYSDSIPGDPVDPGSLSNNLSLNLNGDSGTSVERIVVTDSASLDAGLATGFTLEAFVNPAVHAERNTILSKWATGGTSYIFRLNNSGQIQFFMNDGTDTTTVTSSLSVPTGSWSHVAATWGAGPTGPPQEKGEMHVYVDGVLDTNFGLSLAPTDSATELWIGASDGGTDVAFNGALDEIRISDMELMPSEFLTAFNETTLVVNRLTGLITLNHDASASAALAIQGYSITSDFGSLEYDDWKPVAGNYDASVGADMSVDSVNEWTPLTDSESHSDLSEFEFGGTGGSIAAGQSVVLSEAGGAWIPTTTEDLRMTIILPNGDTLDVPVVYEETPLDRSDLNHDGTVDDLDWPLYRDNTFSDLSGFSPAEKYLLGDLDKDGDNDFDDFTLFKLDYDNAQGSGAFAAMVASVPEPSSLSLLLLCSVAILGGRGLTAKRYSNRR